MIRVLFEQAFENQELGKATMRRLTLGTEKTERHKFVHDSVPVHVWL
jgi:hypothetical protein